MPKFKFTTSIVLVFVASAAAGVAHGYYQAQTCTATQQGVQIAPPIYYWQKSPPTTGVFAQWLDTFQCGQGMLSLCNMCYETEFNYITQNGQAININTATVSGATRTCGVTATDVNSATFPAAGQLTPGTTYQLVFAACAWNPAFPGCGSNVQFYQTVGSIQFVAASGPPQ